MKVCLWERFIYIYIYIYRERERGWKTDRQRQRKIMVTEIALIDKQKETVFREMGGDKEREK